MANSFAFRGFERGFGWETEGLPPSSRGATQSVNERANVRAAEANQHLNAVFFLACMDRRGNRHGRQASTRLMDSSFI